MVKSLSADEVLSNAAYGLVRDRERARVVAEKRGRRIPLGDDATLTFESRATVLFQIQEVMWIEQRRPEALAAEIAAYACLVPSTLALRATLMIHGASAVGAHVGIVAGGRVAWGEELEPGDPADPVRYLGFAVDAVLVAALERDPSAHLVLACVGTQVVSALPPLLALTLANEALEGEARGPSVRSLALANAEVSPSVRTFHPASENPHVRTGGPQGS